MLNGAVISANDMICDAGRKDRFIYVLQEWIISRAQEIKQE